MTGNPAKPSLLRFGTFELDRDSGELRKAGRRVRLQPQPFKILALLASRPGELLTREEIRQEVWGSDTYVDSQQGLNFCIKQIRTALDDDAETPRYIETLPRRGYRFVAPVEASEGRRAEARRSLAVPIAVLGVVSLIVIVTVTGYVLWRNHRPPGGASRTLLLVLPFENLIGDPEQSYLSDGLTEEMISQLGRLQPERLGVIARTTAMRYKDTEKGVREIGRELDVNYIVEGGVRRDGDRIRVNVQLVQARDQAHVWAETYDRNVESVLGLQTEVARAIAERIRIELASAERPAVTGSGPMDFQVYEAYLKGRYHWRSMSREGLEKAVFYFRQALGRDPEYAPAYAGLAQVYYTLSNIHIHPDEALTGAKQAAMRALEIDDTLAEAHAALGLVRTFHEWDWPGAENSFQQAVELDPGNAEIHLWYGVFLAFMGRLDESVAHMELAYRLDPLSVLIRWSMSLPLYLSGETDRAIERTRTALELEPDFSLAHVGLGLLYERKGQYTEAIAELQIACRLDDSPEFLAYLGRTYALAGERAQAEGVLHELERLSGQRYISPYDVALIYAGLGEVDRTFEWLEKAYESRAEGMLSLKLEPRLDDLRSDPRYQDLLRRMRF